jgi:hypothetical protein
MIFYKRKLDIEKYNYLKATAFFKIMFLDRKKPSRKQKYMRWTARYIWTDYKTNKKIAKETKITPFFYKLLEYKSNWTQHVNKKPGIRLPKIMKQCCVTGRKNHGRP